MGSSSSSSGCPFGVFAVAMATLSSMQFLNTEVWLVCQSCFDSRLVDVWTILFVTIVRVSKSSTTDNCSDKTSRFIHRTGGGRQQRVTTVSLCSHANVLHQCDTDQG